MGTKGQVKSSNAVAIKPLKPYEKREPIYSLSLFVTIVNRGQGDFFVNAYQEKGAALSMVLFSYSMPPAEILWLLEPGSTKKDIVMTLCRTEYLPKLKEIAAARFAISKSSKGIAFAAPIDSVSGIVVYKFLADQNKETREPIDGKQ
jgi:hypothetical protein